MSTIELTEAPPTVEPTSTGPRTWTRDPTMATPLAKDEPRRSTATIRTVDVIRMLGSAAAAIGLTSWLYFFALPLQGELGFVLISYLIFLILFAILTSFDENRITVKDRLVAVFIQSLAFILLLALFSVVIYTFGRGLAPLGNLNFFTEDMSNAGPLDPLTEGGVIHAVVGTLIMITIALAISIPLGLLTAVFLSEFPGRYASFVRTIVEAMTALPSIVAGLFIYATIIVFLGFNRSGFAASLAITVMMLPIIIRSADVVLRLVPGNLKEASRALGASTWRTVWNVTLPTAKSGLTTAIILGTARGIGETSPVLLTAGATTFLNLNPFNGPMTSLPLTTFTFVKSPELNMVARGFGTAAVLMVLVVILFALARAIGGRGAGQLSTRQQRARARQSRDDDYRYRSRELGLDRTLGGASRGSPFARLGIGRPRSAKKTTASPAPTRKDEDS
ncbi:phosphate transport system permease protein [Salinibacterium sp. CAN_S4]|uniref:phosphate ABC transporter permease PstA n=1 Tax=Salinibacterium sp. CAN_S4 TaxID=2787727 RepID=UPI0018EFA7F8